MLAECKIAAPYLTWLRIARGPWRIIAEGMTFAESEQLAHDHLRALDEVPGLVETFTSRRGVPPPHVASQSQRDR